MQILLQVCNLSPLQKTKRSLANPSDYFQASSNFSSRDLCSPCSKNLLAYVSSAVSAANDSAVLAFVQQKQQQQHSRRSAVNRTAEAEAEGVAAKQFVYLLASLLEDGEEEEDYFTVTTEGELRGRLELSSRKSLMICTRDHRSIKRKRGKTVLRGTGGIEAPRDFHSKERLPLDIPVHAYRMVRVSYDMHIKEQCNIRAFTAVSSSVPICSRVSSSILLSRAFLAVPAGRKYIQGGIDSMESKPSHTRRGCSQSPC